MNVNPVKLAAEIYSYPVARVHSLPSSLLDGFVVRTTLDILQQISRRKSAVAYARKLAEIALEQSGYPGGRLVEFSDQKLDGLNEESRTAVETWKRRKEELTEALARLSVIFGMEKERAARKIVGALEFDVLRKRLALENPSLFERLGKGLPKDRQSLEELVEEAIPYVLESTITGNDPATMQFSFGETENGHASSTVISKISLAPAVLQDWLTAIAKDDRLNSDLTFRFSDGFLEQDGKPAILTAIQGMEFLFTLDYIPAGHLKRGAARKKKGWLRMLDSEKGKEQFEKLVSEGLLVPTLPEQHAEKRPLIGLSSIVAGIENHKARRLVRLFHLLDTVIGEMAGAGSRTIAKQRERGIRFADMIYRTLGIEMPEYDNDIRLFKEDRALQTSQAALPLEIKEAVTKYASDLPVSVIRSHIAVSMAEWFKKNYGPGGECRNVLEFVAGYAGRADKTAECIRVAQKDAEQAREGTINRPLSPSELQPNGSVQFRIAANSAQAMQRGDYQVLATYGGIGGGTAVTGKEWLEALCPEAEPLLFTFGEDWGSVKRGNGRRLIWPTGRQRNGRATKFLTLSDLTLKHDENTDSLRLLAPEGHPVSIIYNGETPSYQLPELTWLFLTISNPWIGIPKTGSGKLTPGHSPRVTEEKVVKSSAEWRVPVREVPLIAKGEPEFDYFVRLHEWLVASGIPKEVMFKMADPQFPLPIGQGKDQYIHFGSPHLVQRFCRKIESAQDKMLVLTEVFPERGAHMIGRSGHPCVTEFQVPVKWH